MRLPRNISDYKKCLKKEVEDLDTELGHVKEKIKLQEERLEGIKSSKQELQETLSKLENSEAEKIDYGRTTLSRGPKKDPEEVEK